MCCGLIAHLSSFQCWGWGYGTWSLGPLHSCEARSEQYTRLSTCSTEACRRGGVIDLQRDRLGHTESKRQDKDKMRFVEARSQWRRMEEKRKNVFFLYNFSCCVHTDNYSKCMPFIIAVKFAWTRNLEHYMREAGGIRDWRGAGSFVQTNVWTCMLCHCISNWDWLSAWEWWFEFLVTKIDCVQLGSWECVGVCPALPVWSNQLHTDTQFWRCLIPWPH